MIHFSSKIFEPNFLQNLWNSFLSKSLKKSSPKNFETNFFQKFCNNFGGSTNERPGSDHVIWGPMTCPVPQQMDGWPPGVLGWVTACCTWMGDRLVYLDACGSSPPKRLVVQSHQKVGGLSPPKKLVVWAHPKGWWFEPTRKVGGSSPPKRLVVSAHPKHWWLEPICGLNYKFIDKITRKKKRMLTKLLLSLAGFEPVIPCFVVRCLIDWAT